MASGVLSGLGQEEKVPRVRYVCLDRVPVRSIPRGYVPSIGVTMVDDRQVSCLGGFCGLGWATWVSAIVFLVEGCGRHIGLDANEVVSRKGCNFPRTLFPDGEWVGGWVGWDRPWRLM